MRKFSYRARDKQGKLLTGAVEAGDQSQAVNLLHQRGLTIISLSLYREKSSLLRGAKALQRVSFGEIVNFTRQLSTMITAGLPLTDSLYLLEAQLGPGMAEVIADVLRRVEGGETLANAFAKHPEVFSPVYIALVQAGESAGVLDQVLKRMAANLEKRREFQSKVKGAMVYPSIVVIGMITVALLMTIFVIPKMAGFYEEFGTELPLPTRVMVGISNFFISFWWLLLIIIACLVYLFSLWKKTKRGQKQLTLFLFRMPILGDLNKKIILTEFTRTLALLVGTGVSIIRALSIVADITGNVIYKEDINRASQRVEKGFPLSVSLAESEHFPPIVSQMIGVGEESGKIDEVLTKVSTYFEIETEQAVKALTTAIEPIIIVILAIGVFFIILGVVMPIYSLTTQI